MADTTSLTHKTKDVRKETLYRGIYAAGKLLQKSAPTAPHTDYTSQAESWLRRVGYTDADLRALVAARRPVVERPALNARG